MHGKFDSKMKTALSEVKMKDLTPVMLSDNKVV